MSGNELLVVVVGLVLIALVVMLGVTAWSMRQLRTPLRPRQRVMVNLTDGTALGGVLWSSRGRHLVLVDVTVYTEGGEGRRADGQAVVGGDRIAFVQVIS